MHIRRTPFAVTGIGLHAVDEKTSHRIIPGDFLDHGDKMFMIRGIIAHPPRQGRNFAGERPGRDRLPVRMQDGFRLAEAAVEIGIERDPPAGAFFRQSTEQIEGQGRMPDPDTGVVIGVSHIAAGMEGEKIDPAFDQKIGKIHGIEIFTQVRIIRTGMEIIKQGI